MQRIALKVGDLTKQTGVSVQALHYYDEIGLLSPPHRTEAGYRLYGEDDIIRLQQIVSLRQIGFSLEQIRECLEQDQFSPHHVVNCICPNSKSRWRYSSSFMQGWKRSPPACNPQKQSRFRSLFN